ncbi:cytochrome c oxidase assembly protein subunit 15 [Gracilibacillus orientalis]|uniref:Heme A synthase n=1 Tax=Gracilibacillus orientalis TaxID=334253 RepID=A0A1I4MBL0_9BACI|nr:heme A synthase [Gracilibacillus orientalis]SFM00619.1 cytochrome c oxidase assembly protein subunit 15 [Gracilibacillus orientalis]
MMKLLKCLSILSTLVMVFVLVGGSLVTKTGSGMGCGANWPFCYGTWSMEMFIELSHRLVSSAAGIIVLLLSVISWIKLGHVRETKFLAFISIFFLLAQGLIGAAAVLWSQSDFVLALHFGISLISFAAVLLLTLLIFEVDHKFDADSLIISSPFRKQFLWLAIYILVVVYSGALLRHIDSSLACPSWPVCDASQPLSFDYHLGQWVNMGHRLLAGIAFIWTWVLFFRIRRQYRNSRVMYQGWSIATSFITIQVILGGLVIFTKVNLIIALFHALFITLFFGLLCYYLLLSYRSRRK